jgi:hypothetical protein
MASAAILAAGTMARTMREDGDYCEEFDRMDAPFGWVAQHKLAAGWLAAACWTVAVSVISSLAVHWVSGAWAYGIYAMWAGLVPALVLITVGTFQLLRRIVAPATAAGGTVLLGALQGYALYRVFAIVYAFSCLMLGPPI